MNTDTAAEKISVNARIRTTVSVGLSMRWWIVEWKSSQIGTMSETTIAMVMVMVTHLEIQPRS